ncbi:TetR/AcrR family transcriptional regulator [Paenibacillus xylaniclasticus]|uniref:TetR/AcrR family transcriptional regulator n=1 Tax=Paenibacillus xylaniclasticus TaxID=588083 RepID=UPI000FD81BA7|nr:MULTISPECIES: TetR-like C-terminal domain-containing protein [Paenibacillus]GFN31764.1 TetR family transcriptional regulator [Paenibacillus curdlanolyticus]
MSPRVGLDYGMIVRAAATIADESGLSAVTLASLAQKLNVRPPSLYNHVDGLPGVMAMLRLHGLQQLLQTIEAALQRNNEEEGEALLQVAEAYAAFALQHPGLYEATQILPDAENPEAAEVSKRIVELVSRLIRRYLPVSVDEEEVIHAVRGFRSLLHGFTSLSNTGGFGLPYSTNESFQYMMRAYLNGINYT